MYIRNEVIKCPSESMRNGGSVNQGNPKVERITTHHFLFQRRHWQQGYAKALREHRYCGAYIPQATLHRELHSKVHDVPVPNGSVCRQVYRELCRQERAGLIDIMDAPWIKLSWLVEQFEEICPATTAILQWQKEIITKYYKNPSK